QKYDGKYVLRTTLDIPADQVALRYKDLYRIERVMRQLKSILETRPIYHQKAGNIRGHVFCSFLALKLLKALEFKLNENGLGLSLDRLLSELNEVYTSEVKVGSKCFTIRSQVEPAASEAIRAMGARFDQKICQINQQDTDI
ncbi:IS1634 family transposase, partial [bacterium]|nr:IS1634 family transposase [candidate division CSSED10-310 bacterium]